MTDQTARAGKRGPACSKVMELDPLPVVTHKVSFRVPSKKATLPVGKSLTK